MCRSLEEEGGGWRNLTELSLSSSNFLSCSSLPSLLTNLQSLSLHSVRRFSPPIYEFPNLTRASFFRTWVDPEDLEKATGLTSLKISEIDFSEYSLSSLTNLTELAVDLGNLECSFLSNLKNLRVLKWKSGCGNLKEDHFEGLTNLEMLYLGGDTRIMEDDAFRIFPKLQDFIRGSFSFFGK